MARSTNTSTIVVLKGKSRNQQVYWKLVCRNHECLCNILWQSMNGKWTHISIVLVAAHSLLKPTKQQAAALP